jgi:hypothetical protein
VVAAWRGDTDALSQARQELESLRDSENMDEICTLATIEAMAANVDGRHDEALQRAGEVVGRLHKEIGLRHESFRMAWVEAMDAALRLGDLPTAESMLALVTEMPPGFVPPYLKAESARFGARLAAAIGRDDEAERLFVSAAEQLEALGYRYWLARTRLDHAEWLTVTGRPGGGPLAAAAAATFDELLARVWAERARGLQPAAVGV